MQATWKKWVLENLLRGVDARELYRTLRQNGFSHSQSAGVLGSNLDAQSLSVWQAQDMAARPLPAFLRGEDLPASITALETTRAELYSIDNFLADDDCEAIVTLSKQHLRPSTITTDADDKVRAFRTSSTCDLLSLSNQLAGKVSDHINQFFGFSRGTQEPIQAQHYQVGQEFKAHTDYFEPGTPEYSRYAAAMGQRTWTCMVYLNEVKAGGQTIFTKLGHSLTPKKGMAVIWNNLCADGSPNPNTLHHATPVEDGEKSVITKWFRTAG